MKLRLLVMNGQRLLQSEKAEEWVTDVVSKAGSIKPGVYNIYLSAAADKTKSHAGPVLHVDKEAVYQSVTNKIIKHARQDFDKVPDIGSDASIKYDKERAIISANTTKLSQGRSR